MGNLHSNLTTHPEGSVQELWTISFPLILSIFSINIMTFVDRLLLSKYDSRAMNAAVVAGTAFGIFQYGSIGIAAISEVFVGQFNGAKKYQKIGEPVWQMIWLSLMTAGFFIPLGLFAGASFIPDSEYVVDGISYFKWLMLFGPTYPLVTALSSFFVGRGKVKLVMTLSIFCNIINVLLDYIFIFGTESIPAWGASGAALATGVSQSLQAILLFILFLQRQHRETHGTALWQFKPKLFFKTFKIGLPTALSSIIELCAWTVLAQNLAATSEAHITIFSIGDSVFVLFTFGFWGLQKGITTVVANYIGANKDEIVNRCLYSGAKIILCIMFLLMIPLLLFPEMLIQHFLDSHTAMTMNDELMKHASKALHWLWVYFLLDALSCLFCGVLTAAGDTKFVMVMNSINAWLFSILPIYLCLHYLKSPPEITWILFTLYAFLNTLSYFLRYKSKRGLMEQALHAAT